MQDNHQPLILSSFSGTESVICMEIPSFNTRDESDERAGACVWIARFTLIPRDSTGTLVGNLFSKIVMPNIPPMK